MTVQGWTATVAGAGLILLVLLDLLGTLWHPTAEGRISRTLGTWSWRVARRLGTRALDLTGPALLVGVVLTWAGLVLVGAALLYWPHLSGDEFLYSEGLQPEERARFGDALYLSGVVLSTLGFGDLVPRTGWLRAVTAGEGLLGFSLLTAAVTWVQQLQGALVRRRALARLLDVLRRTDPTGRRPVPEAVLARILHETAGVRVDLRQSSLTYYFRDSDARSALALALPYALVLADTARHSDHEPLRTTGEALEVAVGDLAELVGEQFLRSTGDVHDTVRRYALDQGHDPDAWSADLRAARDGPD